MKLKQALFGSAVMRVLSAALTFLNGVVLARFLGPEYYGEFVFVLSIISLGYFISTAGLPTLVLREVSLSNAEDQPRLSKGVLYFAVGLLFVLLLVSGVVYVLGQQLFGLTLTLQGRGPGFEIMAVAIIIFWGLSILFEHATRGLGLTTIGQVAELLLRPGLSVLLFLAFYWMRGGDGVTGADAVLALFVATLVTALFSAIVLLRAVRHRWQQPAQIDWRPWLAGALKNSVTMILLAATLQLAFVLIGRLIGETELGLYRAGYQLSIAAGIGLLAAKAVVGPQIGNSLRKAGGEPPATVLRRAIGTSLLFSLPLALVLLIFPQTVVGLIFGDTYAGVEPVVQVLALGVVANSLFGPIDIAMQVARRDKMMMGAALVRFVLHLGLVVALAPVLGILGAAIAHALALLVWCLIMAGSYYRSPLRAVPA